MLFCRYQATRTFLTETHCYSISTFTSKEHNSAGKERSTCCQC